MKAILLFQLIILCPCSSSSEISEFNMSTYQPGKSLGLSDLNAELSRLPGIIVRGDDRLARVNLSSGIKPSFVLNGQVESNYTYVYDRVKASKLKSVRILNSSDALIFGVRGENSNIIIVETE